MKTTTLIIVGGLGVMAWMLFSNAQQKKTTTGKVTSSNGLRVQWNNGVPASIPQDGTKYTTQVDYYSKNPGASLYDVLFPNL